MTETKSTSRMYWMDQLRGVAIILVLLQHTNTVGVGGGLDGWAPLAAFNAALSPYRIPLLLFLSGMLLTRSLSKPLGAYADGKVRKIVWPLLVWTIPTLALRPAETLIGALGPAHLWFLVVLIFCYLIGVLTKRVSPLVIAAFLLAAIYVLPDAVLQHVYAHAWYGAFFFIGAAAVKAVPWWQQRAPWWVASLLGIAAIAWGLRPGTSSTGQLHPLDFVMSVVGIAAIVWVAPRLPLIPALTRVGKESMVWYVSHAPIMMLIAPVLAGRTPEPLAALILFAVALLGCWGLAQLNRIGAIAFLYEFPRLRRKTRVT